jgi:hypothetical protein
MHGALKPTWWVGMIVVVMLAAVGVLLLPFDRRRRR